MKARRKLTTWLFISPFSAILRQAGHCIYSRYLVKNFMNESQETSNFDLAIHNSQATKDGVNKLGSR